MKQRLALVMTPANTENRPSAADLRLLAAIVADSNDAVTVQDLEGRILAWNPAAERTYGYSRGEALQMNAAVLVPSGERARARGLLQAVARGEKVTSVEVRRLTKDGRTLDVSLTMTALVDDQGHTVGVATTERDVTEHKRAVDALRESAEAERRSSGLLRMLADSIPDPVFVKDEQSRMLFANPATLEAIGKPAQEVLGRSDREFFDDEETGATIVENDRKVMAAGEAMTIRGARRDSERQPLVPHDEVPCPRRLGQGHRPHRRDPRHHLAQASRGGAARERGAIPRVRHGELGRGVPDEPGLERDARAPRPGVRRRHGRAEPRLAREVHPPGRSAARAGGHRRSHPDQERLPAGASGRCAWMAPWAGPSRARSLSSTRTASIVEWIGAATDVTARKRAEDALRESEERFRLLVHGVKDCAIYMLAPDGTVSSWSAAAEQMLGYREEEIVGQHRRVFFTDEQRTAGRPQQELAEALALGRSEEEGWRVTKDGARFWANVLITPLYDDGGSLRGFANVTRDFTDRKRAENALRESEERLRASEAALREADRQKDRFLAMLSHELRNPLAPIRNSLYILDHTAPGGEQAKRAQATIHRQIGHMTWLIDDLLDVTRIAHGKIQLQRERLDLNELAHRTVEDHRMVFSKSDIRLEVLPAPSEVWVDGDRVRLAQVISNLLQNAAKFTPHGGKTTVSIRSDLATGRAILTVRDTGSGIEPGMLPRLFQAFAQADATLHRSKGGLGLGLALVKGLVEMHGGSVSAASAGVGKGATFTITLPLDLAAARVVAARPGLGVTAAPRRVLVIEDNEDAADSLREVLEIDEHVVEVAYTGREGIEKAQAFHPDVVLCDIGLPEMDGYEVARTMRADPELGTVGLIALSGYAQPEDVEMASEAGFDAHLAKPPSIDTLERVLAEVGNARHDQRALN